MTIYRVLVDQGVYTYPDGGDPHPVDIRRTIIDTVPGGACRTPITVRIGERSVQVACGRRLPPRAHCPACHTIVVQVRITSRYLGTLEAAG